VVALWNQDCLSPTLQLQERVSMDLSYERSPHKRLDNLR
jgi:hypothetical protein